MFWLLLWLALIVYSLTGLVILTWHGLCAAGRAAECMLEEAQPTRRLSPQYSRLG
jgi:hypothetical protein